MLPCFSILLKSEHPNILKTIKPPLFLNSFSFSHLNKKKNYAEIVLIGIGASISIGQEIRCLPYAGFFNQNMVKGAINV